MRDNNSTTTRQVNATPRAPRRSLHLALRRPPFMEFPSRSRSPKPLLSKQLPPGLVPRIPPLSKSRCLGPSSSFRGPRTSLSTFLYFVTALPRGEAVTLTSSTTQPSQGTRVQASHPFLLQPLALPQLDALEGTPQQRLGDFRPSSPRNREILVTTLLRAPLRPRQHRKSRQVIHLTR